MREQSPEIVGYMFKGENGAKAIIYRRADTLDLHREDGPAVEWADGRREWWLNGKRCAPPEEGSAASTSRSTP